MSFYIIEAQSKARVAMLAADSMRPSRDERPLMGSQLSLPVWDLKTKEIMSLMPRKDQRWRNAASPVRSLPWLLGARWR
mgnify:CR=1 FL=1